MKQGFYKWLREAFSEKGIGSAKRLCGFLICSTSMGCIIYLCIRDGGTSVVEDLLQTSMITGASLLGLYSITSIWKSGQISTTKEHYKNGKLTEKEHITEE